jgi:hypothetical protein
LHVFDSACETRWFDCSILFDHFFLPASTTSGAATRRVASFASDRAWIVEKRMILTPNR